MSKAAQATFNAHKHLVRETVASIFKKSMNDSLIQKGFKMSDAELESFVQLCMMGVCATGEEDPRSLFDKIGDKLLHHMASKDILPKENRAVDMIHKLSVLEWCRRNGHMNDDWYWKWNSPESGNAVFKMNISFDEALRLIDDSSTHRSTE